MIRKFCQRGEHYPRGYGFAYLQWRGGDIAIICYPVPLNMAMRAVNAVWQWMRHGYGVRGMTFERRILELESENAQLLKERRELMMFGAGAGAPEQA